MSGIIHIYGATGYLGIRERPAPRGAAVTKPSIPNINEGDWDRRGFLMPMHVRGLMQLQREKSTDLNLLYGHKASDPEADSNVLLPINVRR